MKREKSQWSVYQLYMVCAEKLCGLQLSKIQDIGNIAVQVFRGVGKILSRYQSLVIEAD